MAARPHKTSFWRSARGRSVWALRCLLLIVAWQGPLPWCHCHEEVASAPGGISCWLASHLRTHHPSMLPLASAVLGWHVHFDYPCPNEDEEGRSGHHEPSRLPGSSAAEQMASSILESASGVSQPLPTVDGDPAATSVAASDPARVNAHFFDDYAPSLALPLRFCIARC